MKKYLIIIGNFGSGKTELALNIAFEAAETKKVTFVDLDIVNPYFRSTERKAELEAAGIRLLSPSFTNLGVEVPSLPAEIFSAFSDNSDLVIFDVGGDDTGAIALGQYHRFFSKIDRSAIEVLYVVNARRPFSAELESNLDMIEKVTGAGRIEIDALVNNTNLSQETSVQEPLDGYKMLRSISERLNLPVRFTVGVEPVISEFAQYAKEHELDENFIGTIRPIKRYMHRDWDSYTKSGHRADSLPWGFNESSDECLKLKAGLLRAIRCAYTEGKRCFLSGMASGVDIYAAEAVLQLRETLPGIALVCVFPCPSRDSRSAAIAAAADSVIVLSSEYCAGCMKRRNRFLVENASMLIAVYDGRRTGGTFQTVGMAARRGLRTVILNPTAKKV